MMYLCFAIIKTASLLNIPVVISGGKNKKYSEIIFFFKLKFSKILSK